MLLSLFMRSNNTLFIFALGILCVGFVLASVIVIGGGIAFSSVNESSYAVYNFSVENTHATENITEVNVTLPTGFVFVASTNGSNSTATTFTNTSTVLTWVNSSAVSLVENLSINIFWFNVSSSSSAGDYNFTITVSNTTGVFETQNLSVTVNDTVSPQIATAYPTNISYATAPTQFNFTYTEASSDSVWYSNDSGVTNYSIQANTSNFTGMVTIEGLNNWTVYMNDTTGSENSSVVFFTVDTVAPVAAAACSSASVLSGATVTCTCSGTDGGSGINASLTTAGTTTSTSSGGTFSYTCSVTDNAGNSHSNDASYTVIASSSSSGGSPTYKPSGSRLLDGYSVSLGRGFGVDFNLEGASHRLVVDSISADSAAITIFSEAIALNLGVEETKMVDVDGNGFIDLSVYLKSISSSRANFVLTSIIDGAAVPTETAPETAPEAEERVFEDIISGRVIGWGEENRALKTVSWIIAVVVLVALVVFWVKTKNKK